jgi:hypothetical protein
LDPACVVESYSSYGDGKQMKLSGIMATNKSWAEGKLPATTLNWLAKVC